MDDILRKYQHDCSLGVRKLLRNNKRVILQSPTGAGKTIIACHILNRSQIKNLTAVFLTDRIELVKQTFNKLNEHVNFRFQEIVKETKVLDSFANLYVGMVETFHKRQSTGWFDKKVDLFVLDEAHIGNYFKVIDNNPESWVIGLTATPVSSSTQYSLTDYYQSVYIGPSVRELIEQKYLCPARSYMSFDVLNMQTKAGEFSEDSQKEELKRISSTQKIIQRIKSHDRKWICFNVDIEHSIRVCESLRRAGINAIHVDSKCENRDEKIQAYKDGEYSVLCNVGITTKGFDDPATSGIILNRATSSISLYFQMIGRGSRIYNEKEDFVLFDLGNNIFRHGNYDDPVDWLSIFKKDSKDKSTKFRNSYCCKSCEFTITNRFLQECPVCGSVFPENLFSTVNDIPQELQKDVSEMSLSELSKYGKLKGYKNGWAWVQNKRNLMSKYKGWVPK